MMEKIYTVTLTAISDDKYELSTVLDHVSGQIADGYTSGHLAEGYWEIKEEERCEHCFGSGEVATDEDDGEGHTMRGVGTQKCICQSN